MTNLKFFGCYSIAEISRMENLRLEGPNYSKKTIVKYLADKISITYYIRQSWH